MITHSSLKKKLNTPKTHNNLLSAKCPLAIVPTKSNSYNNIHISKVTFAFAFNACNVSKFLNAYASGNGRTY